MPGDSGSINLQMNAVVPVTVQGAEEAKKKLKGISDILTSLQAGFDFRPFAKSMDAAFSDAVKQAERFSKALNSGMAAEGFLKSVNAYIAQGGSMAEIAETASDALRQAGTSMDDLMSKATSLKPEISQIFSVDAFKTFYQSLKDIDSLELTGLKKAMDAATNMDTSQMQEALEAAREQIERMSTELEELRQANENLADGTGVRRLEQQLDEAQEKLDQLTRTANREFNEFLKTNNLQNFLYDDEMMKGSYKTYSEYFRDLFVGIQDGSISAKEAIADVTATMHEFMQTGGDALASALIEKFQSLVEPISRLSEEVRNLSAQIETAFSNGGIRRATDDMAKSAETGASAFTKEAEAVERVSQSGAGLDKVVAGLTDLTTTGNTGISETKDSLLQLLQAIQQLGNVDNSKLANISNALASLSDMNGFSATKGATENIAKMLQDISNIPDVSTLKSLSGIDLSNLKVSKAALTNLAEYLPKIQSVDISPLQKLAAIDWTNLAGLKVSAADAKNVQTLLGATGLKTDAIEKEGIKSAFGEIGQSLTTLKQQINDTFNLDTAIQQANTLRDAYKEVVDAVQQWGEMQKQAEGASSGEKESAKLKELIALYQEYYALESKKIAAVNSGDIENADMFRSRARSRAAAIWEEINAIEALDPELAKLAGSHEKVTDAVRKWQESANKGQATSDSAMAKRVQAEARELEALQAKLDKLGVNSTGIKFGGDVDAVERYKAALVSAQQALDQIGTKTGEERTEAVNNFQQMIASVEQLRNELNTAFASGQSDASLTKRIETMKTQWISFTNANSRWYEQNKGSYDAIFNELAQGASIGADRVTQLQTELAALNGRMKASGATGKSFFQQMSEGWRKFGGWSIVTRTFTSVIRIMKQAVTAVKEVDAAMTELRKVTDLTSQGYENFYKSAVQMATQVGSKLSDAISATADFSRLGYDIKDASALAQAALIYTNVGDSIESISDATTSIISTMKAFNIEAQSSMDIVDMFNEVGNNFAISAGGIGDALQRSASSLAAAGNTIEESIGLVVAANDVVQNPDAVGEQMRPAA